MTADPDADAEYRRRLELRRRALADGLDLLGWRFDPLDAQEAHLSVARLGAVVDDYIGDEDRMVAAWWIRRPHVERRLLAAGRLTMRASDAADAPVIIPGATPHDYATRRVWAAVSPTTARADLRTVLDACFSRGYRVVDFELDATRVGGRYLLAQKGTLSPEAT